MEQITTTLSRPSRISSSSNSFQPYTDFSTSTSVLRDSSSPRPVISRNCSGVWAMPPPVPPRV